VVGSQILIFFYLGRGHSSLPRPHLCYWTFCSESHPKQSVWCVIANILLRKFSQPGCPRACGPGRISSGK